MPRLTLATAVIALCALAVAPASAGARRSVPQGFVGMNAEGPTLQPNIANLATEMNVMVRAGVESVRTVFPWADEQPFPNAGSIPAGQASRYRDVNGIPTNFAYTDRIVGLAALRHLSVLPVIWHAPSWASRHPEDQASPPKGTDDVANYAAALVERYGPNGSFWAQYPQIPKEPIRRWQVWNEPNITTYWLDQPFAADYVTMLRAVRAKILAADPGAQIVLAGFVNDSWDALSSFYAAGGRGLADILAVHPFTRQVRGVVTIIRRYRAVMARNGEGGKPIIVSELSWPSAQGKVAKKYLRGFEVTPTEQAVLVREAYAILAHLRQRLKILQVDWYSWLRYDAFKMEPFDYAGLRHVSSHHRRIEDKPALGAFKKEALRLEGCRRKEPRADNCHRG
jgi:hypothetical protein